MYQRNKQQSAIVARDRFVSEKVRNLYVKLINRPLWIMDENQKNRLGINNNRFQIKYSLIICQIYPQKKLCKTTISLLNYSIRIIIEY